MSAAAQNQVCVAPHSLATVDTLHDVFFGPSNIEYTVRLLLDTQVASDSDFLTQLLGVMCTHPVQILFTDHGFTPFAKTPLVIIPYSKMTKAQLLAVDACLEDAARDVTNFKVGSLMGGGSSVHLICPRSNVVDTVELLLAVYNIILSSKTTHANAGVDVSSTFNLILQRLVCSIGLPRAQILSVRERIFAQ
jgi:hypothetical protein